MTAGFGWSPAPCRRILGGQFLTDLQTFVAALDTVFGGLPPARAADLRAAPGAGTAFLVVARPEPTRCARRRTSSSGSARTGCRWPAWSSTGQPRRARLAVRRRGDGRLARLRREGASPTAALTAGLLRLHADRDRTVEREAVLRERFAAAHPAWRPRSYRRWPATCTTWTGCASSASS
jgi:hypothetical protein